MKKTLLLILLALSLSACTTLHPFEKSKLAEIEYKGIIVPHERVKTPFTAGALNILPGFGNFYLAWGTSETEQWLYGFTNLLLWPYSIAWGVPEAYIDAGTINKRNTIYYYTFGPGARELGQEPQRMFPLPPEPKKEPDAKPKPEELKNPQETLPI